jgi:hypothetical protein
MVANGRTGQNEWRINAGRHPSRFIFFGVRMGVIIASQPFFWKF